ncbi:Uncharacterised protein [Actinobacillus equuli]|nr:Uncharacterised protein [Actinobacillus equuli]
MINLIKNAISTPYFSTFFPRHIQTNHFLPKYASFTKPTANYLTKPFSVSHEDASISSKANALKEYVAKTKPNYFKMSQMPIKQTAIKTALLI